MDYGRETIGANSRTYKVLIYSIQSVESNTLISLHIGPLVLLKLIGNTTEHV